MIWVVFALMTAMAVLCLVWPLASPQAARSDKAADVAFYASQLAEVDGEIARGLVSPVEAEATRAEIGRRLLASAGRDRAGGVDGRFRPRRVAAAAVAVLLMPALAVGLYLRIGHPGEPDQPVASRPEAQGFDLASAIPKVEAHLAAHPDDGRGFELIAPIYLRMGRFDDAAKAYAASLRSLGETAARRAALGQALFMAADGVVTTQARTEFGKALADDPKLPQARFFLALATEQDGDKAGALALWRSLAADSPPDAPWRAGVDQHIAALTGQTPPAGASNETAAPPLLPAPTGPMAEGIAALPPAQRLQAIRGMVDGLAARLAENGRDSEGWLRLIKAYTVLGEQEKARDALAGARKGLDGDADALARVDALAGQLGLKG